jgi:SAM-dependent methyltransferase
MSVEPPMQWSGFPVADQPDEGLPCRLCGSLDRDVVLDLGVSPLSNKLVDPARRRHAEPFYPLRLLVCRACRLVQVDEFVSPADLFSEYSYFSSYSNLWLTHAREYADMVVPRFSLGPGTKVVELASNDGYLLQYFATRGIPVLGVEPAANVAAKAAEKGLPTVTEFFGVDTARRLLAVGHAADLLVANNVLAHVPDLNGFVEGVRILLKPTGVATFEFSHVLRMIQGNQFDSIYHEHFCYFSLHVVERVLARHGLSVFDVEELPTHGGSLRVFVAPEGAGRAVAASVGRVLADEGEAGLDSVDCYRSFAARVKGAKRDLLAFLIGVRRAGKSVVGYGAAAKGNTLLNYCGIRTDFLDYVADRSPHKQGLLLPGTGIPVVPPDRIMETRPDYVLLLAWNLVEEVVAQLEAVSSWGGRFVVPLPAPRVLE